MSKLLPNPKLSIDPSLPDRRARIEVVCQVEFTALELDNMMRGLQKYSLDCRLWGADSPDPDDRLGAFATQMIEKGSPIFQGRDPFSPATATFSGETTLAAINEDASTDEIYAKVTLRNLEDPSVVDDEANSNQIDYQFVP